MTKTQSDILRDLESDDELPDVYNDLTVIPAYLVDNRFDEIKFAWINKYANIDKQTKIETNKNQKDFKRNENFHIKGILKYQDLYCLKSIQPLTSDDTFLWFANFLMNKELQSHTKYLKSVLVNDFTSPIPLTNKEYKHTKEPIVSNRFEIIIKHKQSSNKVF